MTEAELRAEFVRCAESYAGAKQGGAKHRDVVAVYNSYRPQPRGYALTLTDPWCAAFVSAIAILVKLTDIIPIECSCKEQIKMWEQMGRWEERDDYVPSSGDLLYYDWEDKGVGDCTGGPDHVGIVVSCSGTDIRVIEGNKSDSHVVGYRDVRVNGILIRGFGLPDFAAKATGEPETPVCEDGCCLAKLPILQRGARGEAVRAMQTLLCLRLERIDVDGSFGPETERVLKQFQQTKRLAQDGSCGPLTWAALIGV